jgi:type I restriction enzyme, S subunit
MTVEVVPLRRLASVVNGGTPPVNREFWGGEVAWATPVDLARVDGGAITATDRTLTPEGLARSGAVPRGSVVLSTRAPIGYVSIADTDMAFNQGCKGIVPGPALDGRYLQFWLWSQRPWLQALGTGSTFMELGNEALMSFGIPARSTEEQQRIADHLDDQTTRIDRLISGRQQQIGSVTEAIGAFAFAAVTGQARSERESSGIPWAPSLPVGWGSPRLNQVARMGTGHTPSRSVPRYWVDCDIPWLTTTDVHKFRKDEIDTLDETEIQISGLGLANSAAVLHPQGTVALSRTASAGFSIVMGREMATSQDFATWTCGPALDSRFVLWCLRAMRRDLLGRLAMGSTHKTIYFPDLMSIRVPLPPLAEQRDAVAAITGFAADARGAKAEIARSIDLLQEFKRSLISAAVSGEFDVSAASGRGVPA